MEWGVVHMEDRDWIPSYGERGPATPAVRGSDADAKPTSCRLSRRIDLLGVALSRYRLCGAARCVSCCDTRRSAHCEQRPLTRTIFRGAKRKFNATQPEAYPFARALN